MVGWTSSASLRGSRASRGRRGRPHVLFFGSRAGGIRRCTLRRKGWLLAFGGGGGALLEILVHEWYGWRLK